MLNESGGFFVPLVDRSLLKLKGEDCLTFLQGIISNDINKLRSAPCMYALMLTPQGKFLYDFFIYKSADNILLDCNSGKKDEIKKKLLMYKLRSKVEINDADEFEVVATSENIDTGICVDDPRNADLPKRAITKHEDNYKIFYKKHLKLYDFQEYEKLRISACIASDKDMNNSFPLEYQMDEHGAIDYKKGCYIGQEVTARTHHRGTLRKAPMVVIAPQNADLTKYQGLDITHDGIKLGVLKSTAHNIGLALIRTEDFVKAGGEMEVSGIKLQAQ